MDRILDILEKNPAYNNVSIYNSGFHFIYTGDTFSGNTIREILRFINGIRKKFKRPTIPIYFEFTKDINISDKLSYIIFECILYLLMEEYNYKVYLYWKPKDHILTDGVKSSPLLLLNNNNLKTHKKFLQKFKFDTFCSHYRRVVDLKRDGKKIHSIVFSDVLSFLSTSHISDNYRNEIAEVIVELVGNACEHGESQCLMDIDFTDLHGKEVAGVLQSGTFVGVNIAILNFSSKLFNSDIKFKVNNDNIVSERYEVLRKTHNIHAKSFSEKYTDDDFWNLACLQNKISGRIDAKDAGGTGSKVLINSLQKKADNDNCYLLSGNRITYFIKELLNYDDDDWIGFNSNNDFLNSIPNDDVFTDCPIFFPGAAYNLNFVMKVE